MDELSHICFAGDDSPAGRLAGSRRALPVHGPRPFRRHVPAEGASLDPFLEWLFARGGLDAAAYRPRTLERRLPACLRRLGVRFTPEAFALLRQRPELVPAAIESVLIGVSEFFRDPAEFDYLRLAILPPMLRSRGRLRIYSAGCAEGQELYSMAMLLDERGALEGSDLLGIDCRAAAIQQARHGIFEARDVAGVEAAWRERYFSGDERTLGIAARLRERMRWRTADLSRHRESSVWDMILCRNVAIYLSEPEELWARLVDGLAPGGILMTGTAELPQRGLSLTRLSRCVFRKVGHA